MIFVNNRIDVKKIYLIALMCILHCNYMYTMRRLSTISSEKNPLIMQPQKIFSRELQRTKCAVPLFSFQEIGYLYSTLSERNQQYAQLCMTHALIFTIAISAQDVRNVIIGKLFDDDQEAIEQFCTMPIASALRKYQIVSSLMPLKIGSKNCSIADVFKLSHRDREYLVGIGRPSIIAMLLGKRSSYITDNDCKRIENMPPHIKKNLEVRVISQARECVCMYCCMPSLYGISCLLYVTSTCGSTIIFSCCIGGPFCLSHHYSVIKDSKMVRFET